MKQLKTIKNLLAIALLALATSSFFAQKVEFETIEINYLDIGRNSSGVKIRNGSLIFSETTSLGIETTFTVKKDQEGYTAKITLKGKDSKGSTYMRSIDVAPFYKTESIKRNFKIDVEKGYDFVSISEVTLSVTDAKNQTTSATEPIFDAGKKTSFAVLLNGIAADDFCDAQKLNHVWMDEVVSAENFAVVLGLNNTKKEPSEFEKALSSGRGKVTGTYVWVEGHDQRAKRVVVQPSVDANGHWTFKDVMPINDKRWPPVLTSFEISYVSACNDSTQYVSVFKEKLDDKEAWDSRVKMISGKEGYRIQNLRAMRIQHNTSGTILGGNLIVIDDAALTFRTSEFYNETKGGKTTPFYTVTVESPKGGEGTVTYPTTWNEKLGMYEVSAKLNGSKENPVIIKSVSLIVVNEKNDTIIYTYNGKWATSLDGKEMIMMVEKSEKIKFSAEHYDFGKSSLMVTDMKTFKVLNFSFALKKGSSIPATMETVVRVKPCNKEGALIAVKLKFDEKTGLWTGSQTLYQSTDCAIEVKDFKVNLVNACGDTYSISNKYFDEKNNEWVCQDKCLETKGDLTCGHTDHF